MALTTETFIAKAKLVHGDLYGFENCIYSGCYNPVTLNCAIHGEFSIVAGRFLNGRGCQQCGLDRRTKANSKDTEYFIEKARTVHGDKYSYEKVEYVKLKQQYQICCKIHGYFTQLGKDHLSGCGCPVCGEVTRVAHGEWRAIGVDEFIRRAKEVHGDQFDYSKSVYVNYNTKVEVICQLHGSFFPQPRNHIDNATTCPGCKSSKGEKAISETLEYLKIEYDIQKTFDGLRDKRLLKYDFFIPAINLLIEFDGAQHYAKASFGSGCTDEQLIVRFETIKRRDKLKNEYAKNNNIDLLRIPYWESPNINSILTAYLKEKGAI